MPQLEATLLFAITISSISSKHGVGCTIVPPTAGCCGHPVTEGKQDIQRNSPFIALCTLLPSKNFFPSSLLLLKDSSLCTSFKLNAPQNRRMIHFSFASPLFVSLFVKNYVPWESGKHELFRRLLTPHFVSLPIPSREWHTKVCFHVRLIFYPQ